MHYHHLIERAHKGWAVLPGGPVNSYLGYFVKVHKSQR